MNLLNVICTFTAINDISPSNLSRNTVAFDPSLFALCTAFVFQSVQ